MAHKKKNAEPIDLSSSGVSTLSGSSSVVRKIVVFKNGDRFHRGVKFVINPKVLKDLETLLNQVNERIELSHGAKKLFSANGKRVRTLKDLLDGNVYVAVSNHFIPMNYGEGGEKIWKPPSRKASPIFREDRIRTARSQEPKQRRRETNPRSNSVKPVRSQATKPKIDIFIPGGDESRARKPTKKITTTSTAAKPKPAGAPPFKRVNVNCNSVAAAAAKKAPTRTHVPHKPVAKASPTKKMVKKAPTAPNKKPPPPPKSATPPAALKKHVDVETVHRTPTPERRHSESSSGHRSDSEEKISSKDSGRSLNSRDSSARSSSRSKSRSKSRSRSRSKSRSNSRHSSRSQKSSRSGSRSSRSRPRSRSKSKSRSRSRSHSDASRKSSSSRKAHEKS